MPLKRNRWYIISFSFSHKENKSDILSNERPLLQRFSLVSNLPGTSADQLELLGDGLEDHNPWHIRRPLTMHMGPI